MIARKSCLLVCAFSAAFSVAVQDAKSLQKRAHEAYDQKNVEQAVCLLNELLAIEPQNQQALFLRGNLELMQDNFDQAILMYQKLKPGVLNSWGPLCNLANAYANMGLFESSLEIYQKLYSMNPKSDKIQGKLLQHHLRNKNWKAANSIQRLHTFHIHEAKDRRVLLCLSAPENGYGDIFQFLRIAKELHDAGAFVIVQVRTELIPLFECQSYIDKLVSNNESKPEADIEYSVCIASLMYTNQHVTEGQTGYPPYITPDPKLTRAWKELLKKDRRFKIGICWHGSYVLDLLTGQKKDSVRSVPLLALQTLSFIPGVSIFSLQKVTGTEQLASLPENFMINEFNGDFDKSRGRFMDTAAVMKNLQLVITSDTSIAHLAGALGVPVWLMLPKSSDYRWFTNTSFTPWYGSMKLFRQNTSGKWDDVVCQMAEELLPIVDSYLRKK